MLSFLCACVLTGIRFVFFPRLCMKDPYRSNTGATLESIWRALKQICRCYGDDGLGQEKQYSICVHTEQ